MLQRETHFPIPVKETDCGLSLALSLMFIVAVRIPVAPGVNVTEIVHLPLAATLVPQVSVSAKSPESLPVNVIPVMDSMAGVLLVRVTFLAALVVPTVCLAKLREAGADNT